MTEAYAERTYRELVRSHLTACRVTVQETDLSIHAPGLVENDAREAVIEQRGYLEQYIRSHPDFVHSLVPLPADPLAPRIVRHMLRAGQKAAVGPMAAVAGAMAQEVGKTILRREDEVIIENGGDIFLKTCRELTIGIFAGRSPLSMKIGLKIPPSSEPVGVCTSSGTVGHSLSLGSADAVCVVSAWCPMADAAATSIGNRIGRDRDIQAAIDWGRRIDGVDGLVVIAGDKMGVWGSVRLTRLS